MLGAVHVPNRVTGRKDAFYAGVLGLLRRWRRGPALLLGDTNSGLPGIDEEAPAFGPREAAWLETLGRLGWLDAFRLLRGPGFHTIAPQFVRMLESGLGLRD